MICPVCNGICNVLSSVYAMGRDWHPWCLRCAMNSCKKVLAPDSVIARDGKIFCDKCFVKRYGPLPTEPGPSEAEPSKAEPSKTKE